MHIEIFGNPPSGYEIDHINRNVLDNRKINLRLATRSQQRINAKTKINQSGYRGVSLRKNKYQARVTYQYKSMYGKLWNTANEAALEYNRMARMIHGDFAVLNDV